MSTSTSTILPRSLCCAHRWRGLAAGHLATAGLAIATLIATIPGPAQGAEDVWKMTPSRCDEEWDRIKALPPMSAAAFEKWLTTSEPRLVPEVGERLSGADMYYYMARLPSVIGKEGVPTEAQREAWLERAAELEHKAARAALMRLRYLGSGKLKEQRASRKEYLLAAREAAEAGDPEFAGVMMDTAQNFNSMFHCRREDAEKVSDRDGCDPQTVTTPVEAVKWAEISGWGGNPNAKILLCRMYAFGAFPIALSDKNKAFQWCFSAETTACGNGEVAGILTGMYERGEGTTRSILAVQGLDRRYPSTNTGGWRPNFPMISR